MRDAEALETVVGLALAQLFVGKSAPLNFSRFPDWRAKCCSALFLVLFWQCVDDLISIERSSTVESARNAWLEFAGLCGWDIPLAKSPPTKPYVPGPWSIRGPLPPPDGFCPYPGMREANRSDTIDADVNR